MKVRLKSGQRITLTPEVFVAAMGVEEPEKILKWKKEYTKENIEKRHEEMRKLKDVKTPTGETESQMEARILKELQAKSARHNIQRQQRYSNELGEIGIGEKVSPPAGGEGGFVSKMFGRKNTKKAQSSESAEVNNGDDAS